MEIEDLEEENLCIVQNVSLLIPKPNIVPVEFDMTSNNRYYNNQAIMANTIKEHSNVVPLKFGFFGLDTDVYKDEFLENRCRTRLSDRRKSHNYRMKRKRSENGYKEDSEEQSESSASQGSEKKNKKRKLSHNSGSISNNHNNNNTIADINYIEDALPVVEGTDKFSMIFSEPKDDIELLRDDRRANNDYGAVAIEEGDSDIELSPHYSSDEASQPPQDKHEDKNSWGNLKCSCFIHRNTEGSSDDPDMLFDYKCMKLLMRIHYHQFFEHFEQPSESDDIRHSSRPRPRSVIYGIASENWDQIFKTHIVFDKHHPTKYPCSWVIGRRLSEVMNNKHVDYIFPRREGSKNSSRTVNSTPKLDGETYTKKSLYKIYDVNATRIIPIWFLPIIVALYGEHELMYPNSPEKMIWACYNHLDNVLKQNPDILDVRREAVEHAQTELKKVHSIVLEMQAHNNGFLKYHIKNCHSFLNTHFHRHMDCIARDEQTRNNTIDVILVKDEIEKLKQGLEASKSEIEELKHKLANAESKREDLTLAIAANKPGKVVMDRLKEIEDKLSYMLPQIELVKYIEPIREFCKATKEKIKTLTSKHSKTKQK